PEARASALATSADLALADRDGTAALAALAEAHRLVPGRASQLADRLRILRGRALLGDVDAILAELDAAVAAAATADPRSAARIATARGQLLLAVTRPAEAHTAFDEVIRAIAGYSRTLTAVRLPLPEHLELRLADCEAQLAATHSCTTYSIEPLL